MKLRDHPKLLYKWPPAWAGSGTEFPVGKVGVLKEVKYHKAEGKSPDRIVLVIEYRNHTFSGVIPGDDADFLQSLYQQLSQCLDRPIHEIGNLEIAL